MVRTGDRAGRGAGSIACALLIAGGTLFLAGCPAAEVAPTAAGDVSKAATPSSPGPEPAVAEPAAPGPAVSEPKKPVAGAELIGTVAPAWKNATWIDTEPLTLDALRGQVVLVRFWTDTCPYCEASAPALTQLHREYADRGLRVIGMDHPTPPRDETRESVKKAMDRIGIGFPVALDNDWATLRLWWLQRRRRATSASFLLDRTGKVRHIHPGPELHPDPSGEHPECDADFQEMKAWVEKLLAEKAP